MKVTSLIPLLSLPILLSSCGSSSGGSSNPFSQLGSEVTSYMGKAAPQAGSSKILALAATNDWIDTFTDLKRPGDGSAADGAPRRYVNDILDDEYEADDFSPTVFGRFGQEIEVLEIIGAQVPFTDGVPDTGSHNITAEFCDGDSCSTQTFTAVIAAASDTTNFDVTITLAAIGWKAALRNNDSAVNLVSVEHDSTTERSISKLFWNKSTGKMRYDFIAKQNSGTTVEVHRLLIASDGGQGYIGHIYEDNNGSHYVAISAPTGSSSTEMSVSFEKANSGNDFAKQVFCVNTSTGNASTNAACAGAALPAGDIVDIRTEIDGYADATAMTTAVLGGIDEDDLAGATLNFDVGSMADFLSTVE